jgi:V8-like Glu-specific endopeptidase
VANPAPAQGQQRARESGDDEPVASPPRVAAPPKSVGPATEVAGLQSGREKGETETPFHGWDTSKRETAPADEATLLDVWHASYSSAATVAMIRRGQSLTESVREVIVDQDDREQVSNTLDVPWQWICSLVITAQDGSRWLGSGWLASPRAVITAGHCVYLHGHGGWPAQIDVYPARNGGNKPYSSTATSFRSVYGWTRNQKPANDYGAIVLPQAVPVGFFGYTSMSDEQLSGRLVSVYGYPSDKPAGTLWGRYRQLQQVLPRTLVYNIATVGGQSGSPVWDKNGPTRLVVGIHNYGDASGNSATRITDEVFDNIDRWKNESA